MEKQLIQQRKDLLNSIRRQLDISKQMNLDLFEEARQLENTIADMDHKLKPVTNMNSVIATHKGNIDAALQCLQSITDALREAEQTAEILQRRRVILSQEPELYLSSMTKATELIKRFSETEYKSEGLKDIKDMLSHYRDADIVISTL
jgi:hypothetical protein